MHRLSTVLSTGLSWAFTREIPTFYPFRLTGTSARVNDMDVISICGVVDDAVIPREWRPRVKALRANEVVAAAADWCDLEVAAVVVGFGHEDGGYSSPRTVRARRLVALILYADRRSQPEIAQIIGYANRRSVLQLIRKASDEDRLDAAYIENRLRQVTP